MSKKEEKKIDLDYQVKDLKTSLIFPLYLCSKELTRRYNHVLKDYDITYTQYLVLMYFYNEKTSNLKRIGDVMMLDSSTLTPLLRNLEKKGFIKKKRLVKDERNLVITLTDKAKAMEDDLRKIPSSMKKEIALTDEEIEVMHDLMLKVLINIKKKEEEEKQDENR